MTDLVVTVVCCGDSPMEERAVVPGAAWGDLAAPDNN